MRLILIKMILLTLITNPILSQETYCGFENSNIDPLNFLAGMPDCRVAGILDPQNHDLSIATLNVNFHFIGTSDIEGSVLSAYHLIDKSNDFILSNLSQYFDIPNTIPSNFFPEFFFRLQIYSEEGNPNDPHGGVFLWESEAAYNSAIKEYNGKVLNIEIIDKTGTVTGGSTATNASFVELWNMNFDQPYHKFDKVLVHEIGHIFGLSHVFYCMNPCDGIDIVVTDECNPPPTNTLGCRPFSPGGGPGQYCEPWETTSRQLMGNNALQDAISRCQWDIFYDRLISSNLGFIDFKSSDNDEIVIDNETVWN